MSHAGAHQATTFTDITVLTVPRVGAQFRIIVILHDCPINDGLGVEVCLSRS